MTTCQPRSASAFALHSPTPDEAPVMMTVLVSVMMLRMTQHGGRGKAGA